MAVKASGRFVPPSAFAAGTGKAFTGAYAWNAPREAVGRERPLIRSISGLVFNAVTASVSALRRLSGLSIVFVLTVFNHFYLAGTACQRVLKLPDIGT